MDKKIYNYLSQCLNSGSAADVSYEGTIFEKDEPMVSFLSKGTSRNKVIQRAKLLAGNLIKILEGINTEV